MSSPSCSGGLVALVAAVALTLVPAAFNSSTPDGLSAYVVANTRGPLPAGTTLDSTVRHFVHVINANDLGPGGTRQLLANAFVIDSVDVTTFRDGVQVDAFTYNAPPNSTLFGARWPTTVTGASGSYVVGKPAIIPGENTVAVFFGQPLGYGPGTYVFKYTLHGTLNGIPVDLSATSPKITATG